MIFYCFPGDTVAKKSTANVGDSGSIPGSGRSPGGGNGNPLGYSCLENPMDRGAWQATVQRVGPWLSRAQHHMKEVPFSGFLLILSPSEFPMCYNYMKGNDNTAGTGMQLCPSHTGYWELWKTMTPQQVPHFRDVQSATVRQSLRDIQ